MPLPSPCPDPLPTFTLPLSPEIFTSAPSLPPSLPPRQLEDLESRLHFAEERGRDYRSRMDRLEDGQNHNQVRLTSQNHNQV